MEDRLKNGKPLFTAKKLPPLKVLQKKKKEREKMGGGEGGGVSGALTEETESPLHPVCLFSGGYVTS